MPLPGDEPGRLRRGSEPRSRGRVPRQGGLTPTGEARPRPIGGPMRRTPRIPSTPKTPRTLAAALAALALAAGLGLAGCGGSAPPTSNATATGTAADTFPVTVGPLTLTERPDRIVVLTPSLTETV